jgi:hypothetical protein
MTSYNAANERMKRQYFAYLAEAQGHSEQSIDAVAKAISQGGTLFDHCDVCVAVAEDTGWCVCQREGP